MKTFATPNFLKFFLIAVVLTLLFRYSLSTSIHNQMSAALILTSVLYGVLMWVNGYVLGKKEYENLPIYDIGFRFHLATFIAFNGVSLLWFALNFQSKFENTNSIYMTAGIWSIFLISHFIYYISIQKSSIKNLNKEDIFE